MWTVKITISRVGRIEHTLTFSHSPIRIGGTPENDVVLGDAHVSRNHAHVLVSQGQLVFYDHSTNGSFCAGERITKHIVQKGDIISIPPFDLSLELTAGEEAYQTVLRKDSEQSTDVTPITPPVSSPIVSTAPSGHLTPFSDMGSSNVEISDGGEPEAGSAQLALFVLKGPSRLAGSKFPLLANVMLVGREQPADIVLPSATISRKHASISRDPQGKWILTDLDSLNCTFIKGRRIDKATLRLGDEITFGRTIVVRVVETQSRVSKTSKAYQKEGDAPPDARMDMSTIDRTLQIRTKRIPGLKSVQVIEVSGRIDAYNYRELSEKIREGIDSGQKYIVIDFAGVTFIDSTGFGVLAQGLTDLQHHKGELLLTGVSQGIRDALALNRLDVLFGEHIFSDHAAMTEHLHWHLSRSKKTPLPR